MSKNWHCLTWWWMGMLHIWGDVYHMFKRKNFSIDAEDRDELKIFKNIRKYGIHRVEACTIVFPCVDAITWILNHVEFGNRYI
jgi:hypothetical protein